MMSPEPTDPTPPNAWFDSEYDLDSHEPTEPGSADVPLDPTDPDALHRLLQGLRKL